MPTTRLLSALRRPQHIRIPHAPLSSTLTPPSSRCYSATTTPPEDATPPYLQKIKAELKTAMRAKDTPRLSVVRAILSANVNASKTPKPIRTDADLVRLMRRLQKSAQDAIADAKAAGRDEIITKENEQVRILDEYIANSGVETFGEAQITKLIRYNLRTLRKDGLSDGAILGIMMGRMRAALQDKDVDWRLVERLFKEVTAQ
ncbi:hypothetical protein E4U42_006494 [Claviceps africana]|uniref:Altered inheritance of mitochondria protein 41 n=1 Tax=Claviceps africana TaxID=83212 RepID=A0A8K0NGP0_9HYPO|nr:hypothetical protein E4U42_006494 [Claviceps africana]